MIARLTAIDVVISNGDEYADQDKSKEGRIPIDIHAGNTLRSPVTRISRNSDQIFLRPSCTSIAKVLDVNGAG